MHFPPTLFRRSFRQNPPPWLHPRPGFPAGSHPCQPTLSRTKPSFPPMRGGVCPHLVCAAVLLAAACAVVLALPDPLETPRGASEAASQHGVGCGCDAVQEPEAVIAHERYAMDTQGRETSPEGVDGGGAVGRGLQGASFLTVAVADARGLTAPIRVQVKCATDGRGHCFHSLWVLLQVLVLGVLCPLHTACVVTPGLVQGQCQLGLGEV